MKQQLEAIGLAVLGIILWVIVIPVAEPKVSLIPKQKIEERTKATMAEKKANRALAKEFAWVGYGWRNEQWACVDSIFMRESRYDHYARNIKSTAFGIGQVLSEKSTDPAIQILRAYNYIEHRFAGNPCKAWSYHLKFGHY